MAGDDNKSEDEAAGSGRKLGRRDVLLGLSTVPALGLFGYAWQKQRSYEQRQRQAADAARPAAPPDLEPIDVALILYEFPEVSTPSAEYQVVRPAAPSPELHVRCEHGPGVDPAPLASRIAERFRDRLGVAARLELVPRGGLPRFAYKAARVVDA